MTGFHYHKYTMSQRLSDLEGRLDRLTIDDVFQPIASLSTTDKRVVQLLVGDRVMHGYFDSAQGCWMVQHGTIRIPEGLYPSHWRVIPAAERDTR